MSLLIPLWDLLFPQRCIFCHERLRDEAEGTQTCHSCLRTLLVPAECCRRCAFPKTDKQTVCPACRNSSLAFHRACAVARYQGGIIRTIHRYKYDGRRDLAVPLGKLMARQVISCRWPSLEAVVPVPLHRAKLAQRRYDQAHLLARTVSSELKLPVRLLLVRQRPTSSQTKLDAGKRWRNMQDAFTAVPDANMPQRILLVDDLLTTGATAHYAARALLQAGAGSVFLAVLAR